MCHKKLIAAARRASLIIILLIISNGCMSYDVSKRAKGYQGHISGFYPDNEKPGKTKPVYYVLLPITVPLDIATSPIQGIYFVKCYFDALGGLGATP